MRRYPLIFSSIRISLISTALVSLLSLSNVNAASAANEQQAAQVALQQNGGIGKVLSVSSETDKDDRRLFAVKILTNGRVRTVYVPQGQ